jgi:PAS domain S-box-containing protein
MTARPFHRIAHSPKVISWRIGQNCGQWPVQHWACWPSVPRLLVLLCSILTVSNAGAQLKQTRRVLILNDLSIVSSPGFEEVDKAVLGGLQNSPYQIELYQESLQVTFFPDEVSQRRFREGLIAKYSERKPDLIVAAGSESLKFVAESQESFIRDTPIIFCAVLGEVPDRRNSDLHFTGVLGRLHPAETLSAALHLFPGTKHVVVVGGMGKFDQEWERLAKRAFQNYESKLEFTYLTDLTMPVLLERLRRLPSNTIVYHTAFTQDATGARFIDSAQAVPLLAEAANAPVFVMDDVDLRAGTVGGDLVNWANDGHVAADIAVRVLNGENPEDIPVVTSNHAYTFDWRALRRWGLKESDLPPGSIVLNREPSFWEIYRRYIVAGVLLIIVQAMIIFALLWQRARRLMTEAELLRSNEQLRLAMEAGKSVGWDLDVKSGRTTWFGDLPTMFGMNSETFVGKVEDFYGYVHPEDRQRVLEAVTKSRQDHEPFSAEFRILWPNGTIRWVDGRGAHEYATNGEPRRTLGMAVDITERKRTEEALKQSEQKFSSVFQESPLAIGITSMHNHRYVDINERYERLTGWSHDEVIGRTPLDIGLWAEPARREEFVKRLLAEGAARNIEVRVRRKDGQIRTTLGSSEIIQCNGEPCALSVFADVTDLKQAEEAERISENRFRQFFDTLPEYCFMTSANGDILDANPAACKALGYARNELIGKSLSTIYALGSLSKLVHLLDNWQTAGTLHDEEMVVLTKEGQKRTVLLNAGSVMDTDGNLLYSMTVLVDITERQRAEAALRESEERFRHVANAAPVLIWMSGPDKLCTYFNQPWLDFTGRPLHSELGDGWAEGVHPDDLDACLRTYTTSFDRHERFEMEYRLRRYDGDYRWVFDRGVPRFNHDGSFAGYIGSCLDVTDRKLAEESLSDMSRKLIEAQEQERLWIARELHDDINQRIALVLVNLERLQRDLAPSAPAAGQHFEELREQLSNLGSDIQALSHHLHSSKLEYLGIVAAATSLCKELSQEKEVKVEFQSESIPKNLPQEIALCLFRVLQESLQNGLKHSESKHFEVWLKGAPNEIELTVRDSGVGFDPEEAIGGRGLGLTSMKERLKLVHGELFIDSYLGRGTVIRATVPLKSGARAARTGA